MARRTRLCPIYSEANPTGQTKEVVTFNGDLVTIIKADNFTLWAYDMRRLNQILDQAFDIDLRHHTNGLNTKNGNQLYPDLREYYFGQNNNGARETRTSSASSSVSSSSDSEVFHSDSDDSMSSTELLDTLRRANQDLHTSDEITAPPSMLKYINVIFYRFHVPSLGV